jgi:psiF repeat
MQQAPERRVTIVLHNKKGTKNMKSVIGAALLLLAMGIGGAGAQTPAPTTPAPAAQPAPTAKPAAPAMAAPSDKKAISKSCTDQANAKGLHGNARKKFRSECKKNGGKAS